MWANQGPDLNKKGPVNVKYVDGAVIVDGLPDEAVQIPAQVELLEP